MEQHTIMRMNSKTLPLSIEYATTGYAHDKDELAHMHDCLEISCVLQGSLYCAVNDDRFLLEQGDLCFINHGQLHRAMHAPTLQSKRITLIVSPNVLTRNSYVLEHFVKPLLDNRAFSHVKISQSNTIATEVRTLIERIDALERHQQPGCELEEIALVHMIFRHMYAAYCAVSHTNVSYDENISLQLAMTTYIYEHFDQHVTLDDIAQAGSVSKSKCARLFQKYAHTTPIDFLNTYRLEQSTALLASTDEAVSRIATQCGFNQQSYYNRLFLRAYNCTPKEYRKRVQRGQRS